MVGLEISDEELESFGMKYYSNFHVEELRKITKTILRIAGVPVDIRNESRRTSKPIS
jgi:predicted RNA methylase